MQPIVVLVAEDVDVIREIVADFLSEAGHCVIQVAEAAQALEVLRESTCSPDLLFTDIKMPGAIDGIELARLASISWPNMKVLITSGHLRPTTQELPERSQFLPKPYLCESLRRAVEAMFSERSPQTETLNALWPGPGV